MIHFILACFAQINLNGELIPCAPTIEYFNVEREIRIGTRRITGMHPFRYPRLQNYPGLVTITGAEILFKNSFE